MADIFISYASDDLPRVEPLAKALKGQGWSVWWDRKITPGKTFSQVIEEAIKAAKCVIVLWSNMSVNSDWVQNEAAEGAGRKILVPALIDEVPIPFEFRRIQAADLTDWKAETDHPGFINLLGAISEIVGPPPMKVEEAEEKPAEKVRRRMQEQELKLREEEQQRKSKQRDVQANRKAEEEQRREYIVQRAKEVIEPKPNAKELPITIPKPLRKRLNLGIGAVALIVILSFIGWLLYFKNLKPQTNSKVTIYQHNFKGTSQELLVGRYTQSKLTIGDDQLSSVKVPKGLKVTLWENDNFNGRKITFKEDASSSDIVEKKFNDKTSSIEVEESQR